MSNNVIKIERRAKRRHTWPTLEACVEGRRIDVRDWSRQGLGFCTSDALLDAVTAGGSSVAVTLGIQDESAGVTVNGAIVRLDPWGYPAAVSFTVLSSDAEAFFDALYLRRYQCEMAIHWIRFWSIKRHLYPKGIAVEFDVPEHTVRSVFSESWKPTPAQVVRIIDHMQRRLGARDSGDLVASFVEQPGFKVQRTHS